MKQRIDVLLNVINTNKQITARNVKFTIPADFVKNIMTNLAVDIIKYTKVDVQSCEKKPLTIKDYKYVSRNKLSRKRPIYLANYVFGPLIFKYLYEVNLL